MCTLFLIINYMKNIPVILISNRDEVKKRRSSPLQGWNQNFNYYGNSIIAPRDEEQKGTWFACENHYMGKWAILTNIRDPLSIKNGVKSRGEIILNYLNSSLSAKEYLKILNEISPEYNLFNIIFSDSSSIYYFHSKDGEFKILHHYGAHEKKIYGLSNGKIDSNWPKVTFTKNIFDSFLSPSSEKSADFYWNFFKKQMTNPNKYPMSTLPNTGVPAEWEMVLSSLFIQGEKYGTRSTLFFGIEANKSRFLYEQNYSIKSEVDNEKKIVLKYHEIA
ncbi:NRDE family protein [Silvanigrella aquatica]|uniref:NRDE family protein n=1 Tax=Silvanigrella aquatica TaxID=1915309 RepID=A0A1L4D404_9BACT|nr:NRDE family protein [Silvanigrella aquatica]APJ04928.1 hypothetical protein AXG55_13900 [Silvanigrella aquatica]